MVKNKKKNNISESLIRTKILGYVNKNKKKIVIFTIALAVLLGILSIVNKQPEGIISEKVHKKTFTTQISANGELKARKSVDLKFMSPGKVSWIGVKSGDKVKTWQAVAKLDTTSLNANYMIALNNLRNFDASAESVLDSVQDRNTDETFAIRSTRTTAEVAKDNAYEAVLVAKESLKNATLISPIAGEVIQTSSITPGQTLTGSDLETKFIRITDLASVYFEADLDEVDFNKISVGQETEITIDAYANENCVGKISEISQEGVQKSGGVTTITVKVDISDCNMNLIPGLNGQANFITSKKEDVLVIPKRLLVEKDGVKYVWLKTGDSVKSRKLAEVSTGLESASEVEITNGLSENDEVIFIPEKI